MSPVLAILAASVTTFAATNLDDLFLLTVFFAAAYQPVESSKVNTWVLPRLC
jgi:cadmium resistance protein CadD (predicted permease)